MHYNMMLQIAIIIILFNLYEAVTMPPDENYHGFEQVNPKHRVRDQHIRPRDIFKLPLKISFSVSNAGLPLKKTNRHNNNTKYIRGHRMPYIFDKNKKVFRYVRPEPEITKQEVTHSVKTYQENLSYQLQEKQLYSNKDTIQETNKLQSETTTSESITDTTTDTTENAEYTTLDDDLLNRMGVPGPVIASLLG